MQRRIVYILVATLTLFIGTATVYVRLALRPRDSESAPPYIAKVIPDNKRLEFPDVFQDFEYVGAVPPGASLDPHGMETQSLPSRFEPGWKYIFHRRNPTDNESLFAELQRRLCAKGIDVLSAQGIFYAYIDGLHFHITFREGTFQGSLENSRLANWSER
jgi:hypothetical protein